MKDQQGIARTLRNLGSLARDQGQVEEARRFYQEALEISSRLSDQGGIARTLRDMGVLAHQQERLEEARRLYQEALEDLRRLGDQGGIARTLRDMSVLAHDQGQVEKAYHLCTDALSIFRQLGDRRNVAHTVYDLAVLAVEQGHLKEALQLLYNAGVGFSLVVPSGTPTILKMLTELRTRVGEEFFIAEAGNIATSPSELTYRLDQVTWEGKIRSLTVQALSNNTDID